MAKAITQRLYAQSSGVAQVLSPKKFSFSFKDWLFPKSTPKESDVKPISAQSKLNNGVEIFTWGEGASGQLGHGNDKSKKQPTKVELLNGSFPENTSDISSRISCGLMHSGVVTQTGTALMWGSNMFMQVGHDASGSGGLIMVMGDSEPKPGPLMTLPSGFKCKSLACGAWHSLLIGDSKSGNEAQRVVYSWGNGTFAQLGLETKESFQKKKLMGSNYQFPAEVKALSLPLSNSSHITKVAAGVTHSVALTQDGKVYLWGNKKIPAPEIVDLGTLKIKSVACGAFHTAVLTEEGEVFTWGSGSVKTDPMHASLDPYFFESVGNATLHEKVPVKVNISKVVSIAASNDTSVAVTESGQLYMWSGTNPEPVQVLADKKVVDVSISYTHIAAITDHGGLYMWRICDVPQPPDEDSPNHIPTHLTHDPCPHFAPTRIRDFVNREVVGVKLGWNFALAAVTQRHSMLKRTTKAPKPQAKPSKQTKQSRKVIKSKQ